MADNIIAEIHFDTAEELWSHLLDPATYQQRHRWVFRGQGDSSWPLVPKAHRDGELEKFIEGRDLLTEKERHEHSLLVKFVLAADEAGLYVGNALEWAQNTGYGSGPWPPRQLEEALALAQHFGLPTRLLDWSRSAVTAAYFAATQAMAITDERRKVGTACVWAFQFDLARHVSPHGHDVLRIVAPARSTNANLNAQGGLFSLIADAGAEPFALEEYVKLMAQQNLLAKLTFPNSEAARLSQILAEVSQATGRSVFPGYGGVVRSLEEEALRKRLLPVEG